MDGGQQDAQLLQGGAAALRPQPQVPRVATHRARARRAHVRAHNAPLVHAGKWGMCVCVRVCVCGGGRDGGVWYGRADGVMWRAWLAFCRRLCDCRLRPSATIENLRFHTCVFVRVCMQVTSGKMQAPEVHVVSWRGNLSKIMCTPYSSGKEDWEISGPLRAHSRQPF